MNQFGTRYVPFIIDMNGNKIPVTNSSVYR